jgi:hypothetical protein
VIDPAPTGAPLDAILDGYCFGIAIK